MKRSPWFNAMKQPPVNGGGDALYEHRCRYYESGEVTLEPVQSIFFWGTNCSGCQWRGLLRKDAAK